MQKSCQRLVSMDRESVDQEVKRFAEVHDFASTAPLKDMWVTVDFGSTHEEQRVLSRIVAALARRYVPFRRAVPKLHC